MSSIFETQKASRIKMLDDLMYGKSVNKDLQMIDAILTKMLRESDPKLRDELWKFLQRWQFRVEIAGILQEATDEELG